MLVVVAFVLYLCGVRSMIMLLAVSFFVTAIGSYILLYKQRERVAAALNGRLNKATSKVTSKVTGTASEFRERLEDGAAAEDEADDAARAETAPAETTENAG